MKAVLGIVRHLQYKIGIEYAYIMSTLMYIYVYIIQEITSNWLLNVAISDSPVKNEKSKSIEGDN